MIDEDVTDLPSIVLADGGLMSTWTQPDGLQTDIMRLYFDFLGEPLGEAEQVTKTSRNESHSLPVAKHDGSQIVIHVDPLPDGSLELSHYDSAGIRINTPTRLHTGAQAEDAFDAAAGVRSVTFA